MSNTAIAGCLQSAWASPPEQEHVFPAGAPTARHVHRDGPRPSRRSLGSPCRGDRSFRAAPCPTQPFGGHRCSPPATSEGLTRTSLKPAEPLPLTPPTLTSHPSQALIVFGVSTTKSQTTRPTHGTCPGSDFRNPHPQLVDTSSRGTIGLEDEEQHPSRSSSLLWLSWPAGDHPQLTLFP